MKYPSFGTRQLRELKLIPEDKALNPGPGQYQLNFNLDDLLNQCEDKELVKAILANLQERKPSHMFLTKEPRIAVFQGNKLL